VAERTRELAALLEVTRNVVSVLALKPLLKVILTQLRTVLDFTGAGIAVLEDGQLRMLAYEGIGFDVLVPAPGHLGLRTMRERAQWAQGTFCIESTRGKGTRIEVRMPTSEPNP
jgi:hypothetical protein